MVQAAQSSIKLYPMQIREDGNVFIVEDRDTGSFFEMPRICIDAIRMIEEGVAQEEIEAVLRNRYPDEEVDMHLFLEQLLEYGLVKEMNGIEIKRTGLQADRSGFTWIPVPFAKLFFNRLTRILFLLLFLGNVLLLAAFPKLVPHYTDWFVFSSVTANMAVWMTVSLVLLLHHELGHLLAVRAEGLNARVGIGYRLFLIVMETEMTGIWSLPKKRRYMPLLAGLCFDNVVLFAALVIKLFVPDLPGTVSGLLAIVIYTLILNMLYQGLFFMKTDLYYVAEQLTGKNNLLENSRAWLTRFVPFTKAKKAPELFPGELKAVRLYALFYVAGLFVSGIIAAFYLLPQLYTATSNALRHLTEPAGSVIFWDGAAFLAQLLLFAGLYVYALKKEARSKRALQ